MKNLWIYPLALLALLSLAIVFMLLPVTPPRWRPALLGIVAFLFTALPASGENEQPRPTCYVVRASETIPHYLTTTPEWKNYRAAYIDMLDYIISEQYDQNTYYAYVQNLQKAEESLNQLLTRKMLSADLVEPITSGIKEYMGDYSRSHGGARCYRVAMNTPTMKRRLALSEVVNRQVQLRKIEQSKATVSDETMQQIKQAMFEEIKKYMAADDLENYKALTLDLVGSTP